MRHIAELLEQIAPGEESELRGVFVGACETRRLSPSVAQQRLGALLLAAYPGQRAYVLRHPGDVLSLTGRSGVRVSRAARAYRRIVHRALVGLDDIDAVRAALRRFVGREKLRIAARELLVEGGPTSMPRRASSRISLMCASSVRSTKPSRTCARATAIV